MPGLFERLLEVIYRMVGVDQKDLRRKRELRRIADELKARAAGIYRVPKREFSPGFARAIYEFFKTLSPLADLLGKTIDERGNPNAIKFWDYLIATRSTGTDSVELQSSYDSILARCRESSDPAKELEQIGQELQEIRKAFTPALSSQIDREMLQLRKLTNLCRHNYANILSHFDPGVKLGDPARKPSFKAVKAESVIHELMDFYFILDGFVPDPALATNLLTLMNRLRGQTENESEAEKLEKKILLLTNRMRKIIVTHLNPNVLTAVMRLEKQDPAFQPERDGENTSFTAAYRSRIEENFRKARDLIQREQRDSKVSQDIGKLFSEATLLELRGYSEETNRDLEQDNYSTFKHVLPLRIVKSFLIGKYEREIREPIRKVLVEGFFTDKTFHENFSQTVHRCEGAMPFLTAWEEGLNDRNKVSMKSLETYRKAAASGKNTAILINRLVDSMNSSAERLIGEITSMFLKLNENLSEIIEDSKRRSPEHVINIKTIGGVRNRELLSALAAGEETLETFIQLMRHFTVVQDVQAITGGTPS